MSVNPRYPTADLGQDRICLFSKFFVVFHNVTKH